MKEAPHIPDVGADKLCYPNMDYQLHCQGENFLSMQTFVPKGVTRVDEDGFDKLTFNTDGGYAAYVFVNSSGYYYYPF